MTPTERMLVRTAKYWLICCRQAGLCQLLAEDGVGIAQRCRAFSLRDLAHDADGKARAGEGLAHDQIFGQAQLAAELTHLVLEEQAQRLDDLLEVDIVGKAADIVVALDDGGIAQRRTR